MFWHLMDFLFIIFYAVLIQIGNTSAIHIVQYPLYIVHNVKHLKIVEKCFLLML